MPPVGHVLAGGIFVSWRLRGYAVTKQKSVTSVFMLLPKPFCDNGLNPRNIRVTLRWLRPFPLLVTRTAYATLHVNTIKLAHHIRPTRSVTAGNASGM